MTSNLSERKAALRAEARRIRDRAAAGRGGLVLPHLISLLETRPESTMSGYLAIGSEVDVVPAMEAWHAAGRSLLLPCTGAPGSLLVFRDWSPGDPLVEEPFGTRAPGPDAPVGHPDVLLVPLLAFDRKGVRLGWGGGFYDRTLADLRRRGEITAVGVAFAAQEVPEVPHGPGDQSLDLIVTEEGVIEIAP